MIRTYRIAGAAALLVAAATLGACGTAEPTSAPTTAEATEPAATASPVGTGLSGEELLNNAENLSGTTITLARCSLLTTPGDDGTLPCRVLDEASADISDSKGLPVDVFINQADLSPEAKAVIAGCDGICTVQISGTLDRATDGTGYLSMTDVSLKIVD